MGIRDGMIGLALSPRPSRSPIEDLAFVLLPALLLVNMYSVVRDKRQYSRFKRYDDTGDRQRMLRSWVLESFMLHGVTAIVALATVGHLSTLVQFPDYLNGASGVFQTLATGEAESPLGSVLRGIATAILPALLIVPFLSLPLTYLEHRQRGRGTPRPLAPRGVEPLLPRNRQERRWTAALSINAGLSEELYFRLLLPTLFFLVTGNALFSIVAATIWFGLAHYYQGWVGILTTMLIGALLMVVYLFTRNIWLAVLIHAVIDLNRLFLIPWFEEWLDARDPRPSEVG